MFDFHLHLARLPQPATLARTLLKKGLRFNAIACEPWEWEVLQKMDASLFEGSTRNYGIHPMAIENVTEADWERLESLLGNYPEAGLGECGLDKRYGGYGDWILKFALTIATIAVGFKGGEVTPLFAIGATFGAWVAAMVGIPLPLAAALGYAAVFGGATNTLFAPIFIGAEIFGFDTLPAFFIVCVLAFACNGGQSIYPQKKLRLK